MLKQLLFFIFFIFSCSDKPEIQNDAVKAAQKTKEQADLKKAESKKARKKAKKKSIISQLNDKIINAYLEKYVIETPFSSPLDFMHINERNKDTPIFSDEYCRDLFGESNHRIENGGFRNEGEYLAGQVLTALGMPTTRACLYQKDDGSFAGKYLPVKNDSRLNDINKKTIDNNGLEIDNSIHVKIMPQYFWASLNKWLVAETDYNNDDKVPIVNESAGLLYLIYDFENAGQENRKIEEVINDNGIFNFITNNKFLTKEHIYDFIHQLKEFIKDSQGEKSSVLAKIFFNSRVRKTFPNEEQLYSKIKQQIDELITYLEKEHGTDHAYGTFSKREEIRENIIVRVLSALGDVPQGYKNTLRQWLMGKNYLTDPTSEAELNSLLQNPQTIIDGEKEFLAKLENFEPVLSPERLSFLHQNKKDIYLIKMNNNPNYEDVAINYIKNKLPNFTFHDILYDDNTFAEQLQKDIIAKSASAIYIVGGITSTIGAFATDRNAMSKIYNNENALLLPKYFVGVSSENSNIPNIKPSVGYKRSDGKPIVELYVDNKGFIDAGLLLTPGRNNNQIISAQNLDIIIEYIKNSAK